MNIKRDRLLNQQPIKGGPVVYWMDRDLRVEDNWALLQAQDLAQQNQVPLFVVYNLVMNFLGSGYRQWAFKIKGLQGIEKACQLKNIPFFLLVDQDGRQSAEAILKFSQSHHIGALVTDFSPLKIQRLWKVDVAKRLNVAFFEVDTHNIVPVWMASAKQEFGAYTLRPKLYQKLPDYLTDFPKLHQQKWTEIASPPEIDWKALLNSPEINRDASELTWILPGEMEARKQLRHFLKHILPRYADQRNDPMAKAQSDLSPYLHYGMLAPQRVALEVVRLTNMPLEEIMDRFKNKAQTDSAKPLTLKDHAAAFLEELIVRRELADNFCYYNPYYDSVEGFPGWAQKTLHEHALDEREFIYTRHEFEKAQTHDELWNASQRELVQHGKMHGYMRMYWAKKILEWTKTPDQAMQIALYLNDKYELDGRDPNGYAGIAWSIGGVHDRAWFERPIFGKIRYMARSGCEKKFDVKAYIQGYNSIA